MEKRIGSKCLIVKVFPVCERDLEGRKYLRVSPYETQTIKWLTPDDPIYYDVESNTDWAIL